MAVGNIGIVRRRLGRSNHGQSDSPFERREMILPDFFRLHYLAPEFIQALNSASPRTTIKTITAQALKGVLQLAVPQAISEQRKIAAVLGLAQRAIEQQERLIALTTELKKALLHKFFTEGLRGEPQKQTEIGPVPESWQIATLGEVANIQTGKLNSNAANPNGDYPFFTCSQETFRIDHYAFDTEAILLSGNNARRLYS